MIVTKENAEERLIHSLHIVTEQKEDRRCVHLQISGLAGFNENEIIDFIHENIEDQSADIFICNDNDFFITARGINTPFINIFKNFMLTHLKPRPAQSFELATLFEVRVDRQKIIKIIENKLAAKKNKDKDQREEQEKIRTKKRRQKIMDMPISNTLVETLPQRRKNRVETEILIVEDDPFSRVLIKKSLEGFGNASIAEDGRMALAQYFKIAPDILFLDIGLPDINGHDVLAKILKHDPHAFIIMLSGKGDKDNIMKTIQNGAKGFVGKPFTREKLAQYIQKSPHIR